MAQEPLRVRAGTLEVDRHRAHAALAGRALALSHREFRLLAALLARRGEVVPRGALIEALWGEDAARLGTPIDQDLYRLRGKLPRAAADAGVPAPAIEAVPGFGYRLRV